MNSPGVTPGVREKIVKMIYKNHQDIIDEIENRVKQSKPLTSNEIIEMVTTIGLTDRQVLGILALIRKKWGNKCITPRVRNELINRKIAVEQFFSKKYVELEKFVQVKGKNGKVKSKREKQVIWRWVAFNLYTTYLRQKCLFASVTHNLYKIQILYLFRS